MNRDQAVSLKFIRSVGYNCRKYGSGDGSLPCIRATDMEAVMAGRRCAVRLLCGLTLFVAGTVFAEPYELSKNDLMDPKVFKSSDISLFGVKLGDPESKAYDILVNEKIPGVKTEQEATFILLLDQRKPTGPMAGVRVMDGKVDLIFINNRFAYKARGLFRNVLNSESPDDIRKILGKEEYGDENVMGAVLNYEKQGFVVSYLGKDVNIEFSPPQ
jgi:D-amino peptidase